MAAPICATGRTEAKRSSRASNEACKFVGIAKSRNAPSSTYRSASLRSRPLSKMLLVNSSTNRGTPSVRATIWVTTSLGNALPPAICLTRTARSCRSRRLSASTGPDRLELGAVRHDQQDRQAVNTFDYQVEQLARGRGGPMRVLEDHKEGLPARQAPDLPDQGLQCPVLFPLRTEAGQRVLFRRR